MDEKLQHLTAPTKVANREIMERVNFLAQAALAAGQDEKLVGLAQYLGTECDLAAKKSQIRTHSKEHYFCKKCKSPLIPPYCAQISKHAEYSIYTCKICHTKRKVFHTPKIKQEEIPHKIFVQQFPQKGKPVVIKS